MSDTTSSTSMNLDAATLLAAQRYGLWLAAVCRYAAIRH